MKRKAMYPGSFDPLTNGHVDIIRRALRLFDEVTIVIAGNPRKMQEAMFSVEERMELIRKVFPKEKRIKVDAWGGLVMTYARKHGITAMIRGLRATGDFENEFTMASMNRDLNPSVETVLMVTGRDWFFISSSTIKEVYAYGGDVKNYVPKPVIDAIRKKPLT